MIIPPIRFGTVEPGLYRGGYPVLKNALFLDRLRLRSIVCCAPEHPTSDLREYCARRKITLHHFKVKKYDEKVVIKPLLLAQILQVVIRSNPDAPCYLHCLNGSHITSLVVMCLRKLQCYHSSFFLAEAARFAHPIIPEEAQFVEQFSHVVMIPTTLPAWLWGGRRVPFATHPCNIPLQWETLINENSASTADSRVVTDSGGGGSGTGNGNSGDGKNIPEDTRSHSYDGKRGDRYKGSPSRHPRSHKSNHVSPSGSNSNAYGSVSGKTTPHSDSANSSNNAEHKKKKKKKGDKTFDGGRRVSLPVQSPKFFADKKKEEEAVDPIDQNMNRDRYSYFDTLMVPPAVIAFYVDQTPIQDSEREVESLLLRALVSSTRI